MPESGPTEKPQRLVSRATSGGRKSGTITKVAENSASRPTGKQPVNPLAKPTAQPAAETTADAEPRARPSAPRLPVPRLTLPALTMPTLTLPKFTLPKLTMPKFTIPGVAARTLAAATVAAPTVAAPIAGTIVDEHIVADPTTTEDPAPTNGPTPTALSVRGLTKSFDGKVAVDGIDLDVQAGAFYGIVGPNGAGKTTTLSMITGLLRPNAGAVTVNGADVWRDPVVAKRAMGVLPDRLRLFDRLTGSQVLYYAGVLRGLDAETVRKRTADLAQAFGLEDSLGRLVTDYSAGMTKKIALAAAMIHTPRLLVLDEPFESVDPVSAATVTEILKNYVAHGGTVVLSSHSMDLVQRICDHVAVIVNGVILADGTMALVRDGLTLEERFVELAGGRKTVEGLEWLHTFSD
jgi:ABC-2 type transport system ATP-binding protein